MATLFQGIDIIQHQFIGKRHVIAQVRAMDHLKAVNLIHRDCLHVVFAEQLPLLGLLTCQRTVDVCSLH